MSELRAIFGENFEINQRTDMHFVKINITVCANTSLVTLNQVNATWDASFI